MHQRNTILRRSIRSHDSLAHQNQSGGERMRILVHGASGVIGQHMRLSVPAGVDATYSRRQVDGLHVAADSVDFAAYDAVVNLMGMNSPDDVERNPDEAYAVNVLLPREIAKKARKYIHVSSQAVLDPVNEYGRQKLAAESWMETQHDGPYIIARPTFVLGVRPLPHVGRGNPAEQMLTTFSQKQVNNRWFSVSFAREVAAQLWQLATKAPAQRQTINLGWPGERLSRYDVAQRFALYSHAEIAAVSHDAFPGIAPRPADTCYGEGTWTGNLYGSINEGIGDCATRMDERESMNMNERAREIAIFLGISEESARAKLSRGWDYLHNAVTQDWNRSNPKTEVEILQWYRTTEAYIWELAFYHTDPGWNYAGQMKGICDALKGRGVTGKVLVLGDGIGDLTWYLRTNGIDAIYHDLGGSRSAAFAEFVYRKRTGESWLPACLTADFRPLGFDRGARAAIGYEPFFDAVVSLDFMEHVPNVSEWTSAIYRALKPGGLFVAQNAFGIGSDGAMPMHLRVNDRFEKDWDPTLFSQGFEQICPQWYRRAA